MMHRFGGSRDLDCSISLEFSGQRLAPSAEIGPIKVIQAVDDTGRSLLRENVSEWDRSIGRGFWQQLRGLRAPAPEAKSIRRLECETELHLGTTSTATQTLRFTLENIRLPWINPPDLEVVASGISRVERRWAPAACRFTLTFFGGPIPNCAGIKSLALQRIECDDGQKLRILEEDRPSLDWYSPISSGAGDGCCVKKTVTVQSPSPGARAIRVIEGKADLFFPSAANGGLLTFDEFIRHPAMTLQKGALNRSGVTLVYLGRANLELKREEWRTKRAMLMQGSHQSQLSTNIEDSLLFSLDDPQKRLLEFEFVDSKGEKLEVLNRIVSTASLDAHAPALRLFTFATPPPDDTILKITLVTPESVRTVPFKVEGFPLP